MPELPEIETIANALRKRLGKARFTKIECFVPKTRYSFDSLKAPTLLDVPIAAIRRRGRYIVLELENLDALVFHLGMSGSLRTVAADEPRRKHEHAVFHLSTGGQLRYEDPRRFGFIIRRHLEAPGAEPEDTRDLGVEPLSSAFSSGYLTRAAAGTSRAIKTLLMDNAVVTGVGNIYANEALFAAKIHPATPAGALSREQLARLTREIKTVLRKAIAAGGSSVSDYRDLDGDEGHFQFQHKVYGREGEPCRVCGQGRIVRQTLGGRGTFFCPKCQRRPKNGAEGSD